MTKTTDKKKTLSREDYEAELELAADRINEITSLAEQVFVAGQRAVLAAESRSEKLLNGLMRIRLYIRQADEARSEHLPGPNLLLNRSIVQGFVDEALGDGQWFDSIPSKDGGHCSVRGHRGPDGSVVVDSIERKGG